MGEYFNYILESCLLEKPQCSRSSSCSSDDASFDSYKERRFHQHKNDEAMAINQNEISVKCMLPHFYLSKQQNLPSHEDKEFSKQSIGKFFSRNNSKNSNDRY